MRPTTRARVPGGDESTARTTEGSFVESVIKSARPFVDYDYNLTNTKAKPRPKSAGAAIATAMATAAAAAAFHPESPEAHALAAVTRFMPVGVIHEAFKGRRLAAVQAWDPQAAAAVRAARAEKLLRRTRLGRTGAAGAPTQAVVPARRRPRATTAGVNARNGNEPLRCTDTPDGRRWDGQTHGFADGQGGDAADWCGTSAARKDGHR